MIFREPCGPSASWHLSYRWGKTPKEKPTQKTCPDWGLNRVYRMTGAHATACSTAVDAALSPLLYLFILWLSRFSLLYYTNSNVLTILLQTKNTVFLFESFNYSIYFHFFVSPLCPYNALLWTRRRDCQSLVSAALSPRPFLFEIVILWWQIKI